MNDHKCTRCLLLGMILLSLLLAALNGLSWSETHGTIRYECRAAQ